MKFREFLTGTLVPLITAATGVFVLFLNHSVQNIDNQLKVREETRLETTEQRLAVSQREDLRLHIYNAVVDSLNSSDSRKQQVATALVISMLEPNDTLRSGLLEVLKTHGDAPVKEEAKAALQESSDFNALQQPATESAAAQIAAGSNNDWHPYNLDVFYCSASGAAAQSKADGIAAAIRSAGSTGRVRVRSLGATINSSPGYQISGLVIRRELSEETVARDLKKVVDPASGDPNGFLLTDSTQGTPGYMSLFVCP